MSIHDNKLASKLSCAKCKQTDLDLTLEDLLTRITLQILLTIIITTFYNLLSF